MEKDGKDYTSSFKGFFVFVFFSGFAMKHVGLSSQSTEITEEAAKYNEIYCEWAPNEKVAMESAFGASLAGKRAFCAMKHVGLSSRSRG